MVCPFDFGAMKTNYPWVRSRRFLEEVDRLDETPSPGAPRRTCLTGLDLDAILDEIRSMTPDGITALIDRAAESVVS